MSGSEGTDSLRDCVGEVHLTQLKYIKKRKGDLDFQIALSFSIFSVMLIVFVIVFNTYLCQIKNLIFNLTNVTSKYKFYFSCMKVCS